MKKLLFSISVLVTSLANAQENWVNVESNGFPTQTTFRLSQIFQNKMYVSGDSMGRPELYSSPNGNMGSFIHETGIIPVLQPLNENLLISSAANANYMFLGSRTVFDTSGGAIGVRPQVYRFDGSTYTLHGTLNYSVLPSNNQLVSATAVSGLTSQISRLALYSPTGSNDTVYAFVSTVNSNKLSVWKASANQTNPTWINSSNFSAGSGITMIYDTKVWHKKLYIGVCNAANGGMILRTANGADWDTVATGLGMTSVLGVNSFNNYFTSFEVYNDALVASVINSAKGIGLIYTADSLSFNQTWSALIDSTHSAGLAVWNNVPDMQMGDGKLWITTAKPFGGNEKTYVVTKNAFNRDTLLPSSGSTGLETGQNFGNDYSLGYFNNAIYATGHSFLGARIVTGAKANANNSSAGTNPYAGNIWKFTTVNPTASFHDSVQVGTGRCQGNSIYLVSTSLNATSYAWFVNGSSVGSTQVASFNPNGPGTYNVKLIAYNGTNQSLYKDSVVGTVTVYANPHIDTVSATSYTICQGQPDTLLTKVSGGARPYTYKWHNVQDNITYPGDSTTIIQLYVVPTPSPYVFNYVTVSDANLCQGNGPNTTLYLYVNPGDSLSGLISDTLLNPVAGGKVYLFQKKANHVGLADSAGVYNLSIGGKYYFPSLYYGDYFIKAVADTNNILYKSSVGTYYSNKQNAYQWDSALVIQQHSCTGGNNTGKNIKILQIPNAPSGPGTITGNVSGSNFFGQRQSNTNSVFGAPLKGVDIKLGKNPGGSAAARTTTDNSGNYSFHNVPIGQYKIYVDIPNYGMDSVRLVDLNVSNVSPHNDYFVDSTMVRVIPVDSVSKAICQGDSILLAGAYRKNAGIYNDIVQTFTGYDSVIVTTLSIKPLPTLTVVANNNTVCKGSPVLLSASGATSFIWSSNAGSVTTSTASISPTVTDTYTVTGSVNGCSSKNVLSIVVNPLPSPTAADNSPVCVNMTLNLNSSGGTLYSWAGPNSYTSSTQNPSITGVNVGATGVYTVTVTDVNSCVNTATISATVNPLPVITASNPTVCVNGTINLTVTPNGALSYSWSGPLGFSSNQQNPSIPNVTAGMNGGYAILITDANGCVNAGVANVLVNALPNVMAVANLDTICIGNNVVITASGATNYTWNPTGATTSSITDAPSVTTTYTITGMTGACLNTTTVTVVANSCIGVKQFNEAASLKVYPIPASNNLFIEVVKDAHIKIYDIAGKVVLEQKIRAGKSEINIYDLSGGAYNMSVNINGQITNLKVMISK